MTKPIIPRRESKAAESSFVSKVRREKGYRCCFEYLAKYGDWERCNSNAPDVCHIISRAQAPAAKHDPRNGLPGCRKHHELYDQHTVGVRVPRKYHTQAIKAVGELSKVPVYREWGT